jgi:hypothetical protein
MVPRSLLYHQPWLTLEKKVVEYFWPLFWKICKEIVWKSSEYVFIYFVRRSISKFFCGQLQCDDRDNKDSEMIIVENRVFTPLVVTSHTLGRLNHGQLSQFMSRFCSCAGLRNWKNNMDISSAVFSHIEATSSCSADTNEHWTELVIVLAQVSLGGACSHEHQQTGALQNLWFCNISFIGRHWWTPNGAGRRYSCSSS